MAYVKGVEAAAAPCDHPYGLEAAIERPALFFLLSIFMLASLLNSPSPMRLQNHLLAVRLGHAGPGRAVDSRSHDEL